MPAAKKNEHLDLSQEVVNLTQAAVQTARLLEVSNGWAASIDPSQGSTVDERYRMQESRTRYTAIALLSADIILATMTLLRDRLQESHPELPFLEDDAVQDSPD